MAIVIGSNSWVSVAEADTYLTTKAGALNWFSLDDSPSTPGTDSKETFLVSAFYWLLDDPGFGLTADITNDSVKRAQIEAAFFLLNYSSEFNNRQALISSGVESFEQSKWSEDLSGRVMKPQNILDILGSGGYSSQNGVAQLLPDDYQ